MSSAPLARVLLLGCIGVCASAQESAPTEPARPELPAVTVKAVVEGTIIDDLSKQPLAGVKVRIFRADPNTDEWDPDKPTHTAESDTAGRFRFEQVEPGKYAMGYAKPGYYQVPIVVNGSSSWPERLNVKPGETVNGLRFLLAPTATVSGRVLDEDYKPVPDARVLMPLPRWAGGREGMWGHVLVKTNGQGEYRAADVYPAPYYLLALPPSGRATVAPDQVEADAPREAYVPTYAPNTVEPEEAAVVTLQPGQELKAPDIVLRKGIVTDVRGRVVWEDGSPVKNVTLVVSPAHMQGCCTPLKWDTDKTGAFTLQHLVPGNYQVWTMDRNDPEKIHYAVWQLQVGDRDMNDVTLRMEPFEASGVFELQGASAEGVDFSSCEIYAGSTAGTLMGKDLTGADAQGAFKLDRLPGGKVTLRAFCQLPIMTYVSSILAGGVEVLGEEVDSAVLAAGGIRVIMGTDVASVSGSLDLADPGEVDLRRAVALLIHTDPRLRRAGMNRYMQVDPNGHFQSSGVRPGDYVAFAVDHVGGAEYMDPEFLALVQSKSVRVTLAPSESKTISLKLQPWPAQFADHE